MPFITQDIVQLYENNNPSFYVYFYHIILLIIFGFLYDFFDKVKIYK
jgi:hypothetical protein